MPSKDVIQKLIYFGQKEKKIFEAKFSASVYFVEIIVCVLLKRN